MRWSVTVTDMLGRPVEVAFDTDKRMATIVTEVDGRVLRVNLAGDAFRSIVHVVTGWPIGGARD